MATFFTLPRELRYIIYQYALTFDELIHVSTNQRLYRYTLQRNLTVPKEDKRKYKTRKSITVHHEKIVAQSNLKLVCQQMHKDIRDVTYHFSEIQFHEKDCEGTPVLQACVNYLNAVPERARTRLRRIVIIETPISSYMTMLPKLAMSLTGTRHQAIYAFCRDHPTVQVMLRLDRTPFHPTTLHIALRMALRDETLPAFPEKHWGNTLGPWDHEREDMEAAPWSDADKSNLLSNYRVTLTSTPWGEDMRPRERGLAERLFEEGC